MDLITALKSGRRIRNLKYDDSKEYLDRSARLFGLLGILSDSWEIEPIKKEISREELAAAWNSHVFTYPHSGMGKADVSNCFAYFCKELGL